MIMPFNGYDWLQYPPSGKPDIEGCYNLASYLRYQ